MSYCVNCGVELDASATKCPLCDTPVYNPDGKEIIARDNEISEMRKDDVSLAYYGCHTDITIPYDELGSIVVVAKDGTETEIIRDGRFVLPGTEILNEPLN